MPDPVNTVLIAGASGVIGAAAAAHFAGLPGWRALGVSRRPRAHGKLAAAGDEDQPALLPIEEGEP